MKKTFYAIVTGLFILSLFIHTSCLEGEINGNTQDSGTRVLIGFPTQQCLDRLASQDASTEQSILDCVVLFTLTITDSFDPIVETFGPEEGITVLVPVGQDRNAMIKGTDENGELCCSGGATFDVSPGQNTVEITCIPVPTPTPTPTPTPSPTPPPPTPPPPTPPPPTPPPPTPPPPTPPPSPTPTPIPTPMPCETDAQCPFGQICESGICIPGCKSIEDCPEGEVCIFVNDVGMCVPSCDSDQDCPLREICDDELNICVPGCISEDERCPPSEFCDFEANMCVKGCDDDFDCPPGKICDDGNMCIPGCNDEEPNCPGNQVCIDGMCQPPIIIPELANDGIDNDGDGRVDCADPDSVGQTGPCGETCEEHETICNDSFDNNGDGKIDCADSNCFGAPNCIIN